MSDSLSHDLLACGLVDTHFHVGPELLDRRYDVSTLAEAARRCRMTLVLKNHTYPTTPLAALARSRLDVRFLGSVVLNRFVGGLNPDAMYGAASGNRAKLEGKSIDPTFVVYMPTVHAESHLRVLGHAFDGRWSCGHNMVAGAHDSGDPVRVFDEQLRPEASRSSSPPTSARSIAIPCRMVQCTLPGTFLPFWVMESLAKIYWQCSAQTGRERLG